jgi:hypothetical protein
MYIGLWSKSLEEREQIDEVGGNGEQNEKKCSQKKFEACGLEASTNNG